MQHHAIPTSAFERDREPTAGQTVSNEASQGRFRCQSELAADGHRRACEDTVCETNRITVVERITAGGDIFPKKA